MTSHPEFKEPSTLKHRYEFVLMFDVANGNPNGDPDADNQPRVDPETGHGLVTDVCIKRKVRNFVALTQHQPGYEIYVKERGILAHQQKRAYESVEVVQEPEGRKVDKARAWMCQTFFDVRTFGAVMTTGKAEQEEDANGASKGRNKGARLWNCGQVRGPVQMAFARSIDPVFSIAHTITRVALTNASDVKAAAQAGEDGEEKAASGQIGRKHGVLYGLYRMHGFISPFLARDTGFTEQDLGIFLSALGNAFEMDRSAARGEMSTQGLWLFEHQGELGNAPAHRVFDSIAFLPRPADWTPRSFAEYGPYLSTPADGDEVLPGVRAWRYL